MIYLRQSTASQEVLLGPFLDDTDGKTAETGLTIANTDIKVWKSGGTSEASKNSGGGTHIAAGRYYAVLDATDTDTVGGFELNVHVSGALPVKLRGYVLEEAVYDALFAASAPGYLQPTTAGRTLDVSAGGEAGIDWANVGSPTTTVGLSGTTVATVTTTTTATNVTTVNGLAANVITATSIASDAITAAKVADGAIDRATFAADTGLQTVRSNTAQAGGATTITLDASASATDDIYNYHLILLTGGTGVGQARYITDYVGSTKVATVASWQTNPDNTTTFAILPGGQIPGATAPTAGEVADAVWDEARSGHVTAGTFGEYVPANTTHAAGTAWGSGAITAGSIATGAITAAKFAAGAIDAAALAADAGTEIGTAVWATTTRTLSALDEDSTTLDLDATIRAAVGLASANLDTQFDGVPTDVRSELTTELARIDVATSTRMATYTQPTGFLAATFPTTVASTTNITAGTITTVTNLTNAPTSGDLTSTMKASVNAEVLDVLNTDTFAQPTGVPTGTESLVNKIGRVHQALISELTVTSTSLTFFSFGGAALWKKTVSDDGTTYAETDATTP